MSKNFILSDNKLTQTNEVFSQKFLHAKAATAFNAS